MKGVALAFATALATCLLAPIVVPVAGAAPSPSPPHSPVTANAVQAQAPPMASTCALNLVTDAVTGADASASAIGWAGNGQGVTTCPGGSFYVQDGIDHAYGFGIYAGGPTSWVDADGYLPTQVTTFHRREAVVTITEFADRVVLGGDPFVAVYCRVAVRNPTGRMLELDPGPSAGLVPLNSPPDDVRPNRSVDHDYVVAVDRFGNAYPWPSSQGLVAAGGFDRHFAHMRSFWTGQLADIAEVSVPDPQLDDAYRSGFIYTQIAKSGTHLDTGVNGYQAEFSHDVIGILANLFTQGDDDNAHALLLEARTVVGSQGQYLDGIWTYSWPWAIYLMKTGDLAFVRANFATPGPSGTTEPSIEQTAHQIAADRTWPGGIIGSTDDIDTDGYWTVDDYEALMGLAAYRYLAQQVGDTAEAAWAGDQYNGLLAATNSTLESTISRYHLSYLPCSMLQPNSANRCNNPEDANWAAPFLFGRWAWDAQLFGAPVDGPGLQLVDATYRYGFGRLQGILPPGTLGGYPSDYYSTAYNAGYGSWGLASSTHRDQGILGYEFMIAHSQSGPYSWWESASAPPPSSVWLGSHPAAGLGSSPHAWGIANANKVLLDSLVAQESDGDLIVGRGVPDSWVAAGKSATVTDFPATDGNRIAVSITGQTNRVSLTLSGPSPGPVLFQLPVFVGDIASSTSGRINEKTGTVQVPAGVHAVTVVLTHPAHN